jgi:nucleotide-binding universal stress UspA family protein
MTEHSTIENTATTDHPAAPRIIVGVDGSPESFKAVAWAVVHARANRGDVELITAWSYPISYGIPLVVAGFDPEGEARDVAAKAVAGLDLPADRIHSHVVSESAATALVRRSPGAELLVVGSRGHGGFEDLLLGSVSTYCVHHAKCSVVVVR